MKRDTPLDQDTLIERAQALARVIEAITETEGNAKDAAASYKEELSTLRKEATRLARVVRTGIEELDCEGPLFEFSDPTNTPNRDPSDPEIPGLKPDDQQHKSKRRSKANEA